MQDGLAVTDWINSTDPGSTASRCRSTPYETSRSLAIHPDGKRFLLGADWSLRAFDAAGAELWRRPVPGIVWAVNISGDGRLALAAYGDGTLRWHRMEDGAELLALFPLADRANWVAWTPEGVYAATHRRAQRAALAREPRLGRGRRGGAGLGDPRDPPPRGHPPRAAAARHRRRPRRRRARQDQGGGAERHPGRRCAPGRAAARAGGRGRRLLAPRRRS